MTAKKHAAASSLLEYNVMKAQKNLEKASSTPALKTDASLLERKKVTAKKHTAASSLLEYKQMIARQQLEKGSKQNNNAKGTEKTGSPAEMNAPTMSAATNKTQH
eukprot:8717015-Ditylum_brightwellii.AAC.1